MNHNARVIDGASVTKLATILLADSFRTLLPTILLVDFDLLRFHTLEFSWSRLLLIIYSVTHVHSYISFPRLFSRINDKFLFVQVINSLRVQIRLHILY